MKSKLMSIFILSILLCGLNISAQSQSELNTQIQQATDPVVKLELLERFKNQYVTDKNKKPVYLNLTFTAYSAKKYDKTIEYGELLLKEIADLEDKLKIQVYLKLANAYYVTKINNDKIVEYGNLCIEVGKKLKGDKATSKYTKQYIVPMMRLIAKRYAMDNDIEQKIKAVPIILEAYSLEKARKNEDLILRISISLYNNKKINEAIQLVEAILDPEKPKRKYIDKLAHYYYRLGNKAKAIEFYKKSFEIRMSAKTAKKLAIMYKGNTDEQIRWFSYAFVLSGMKEGSKNHKFLRHLVYNVKMKGKAEEEQNQVYDSIISAARARTGK